MSSGSFGCNPHDRSATRWAVYGVSVQHNIQHAQVQSSKSSCVPVKGYTVLKREQWACFMLLWDSKQRFSMCDELESKLLNSLNSPAYFDFCWFSILLTNLHQLENSMEQVFVSPKWGPEAPVIEPVRTDWRRTTTGGCCCAVGFFSRLNRKHYPDMKWIWLFKERWPLNSIYIFEWYWNVMAAALFPKMFGP